MTEGTKPIDNSPVPPKDSGETKPVGDATRFLVVGMHNGNGPDAFKVVAIVDSEGKATELAKEYAEKEEGAIFGVFQKVGTARLVRKVEWAGIRG